MYKDSQNPKQIFVGLGEGQQANIMGKLERRLQTKDGRRVGLQRYSKVQSSLDCQMEMALHITGKR